MTWLAKIIYSGVLVEVIDLGLAAAPSQNAFHLADLALSYS